MIPIPEELLEQVERGNVLLFIGERLVRDVRGDVALDRLTEQLAARVQLDGVANYAFPEVARLYGTSTVAMRSWGSCASSSSYWATSRSWCIA